MPKPVECDVKIWGYSSSSSSKSGATAEAAAPTYLRVPFGLFSYLYLLWLFSSSGRESRFYQVVTALLYYRRKAKYHHIFWFHNRLPDFRRSRVELLLQQQQQQHSSVGGRICPLHLYTQRVMIYFVPGTSYFVLRSIPKYVVKNNTYRLHFVLNTADNNLRNKKRCAPPQRLR